ncbi:MAG TPA: hypothetical protein PL037_08995, partial [Elusimicrobiales bacterium]|nr:hypothetical protein [Elusimicrobiales bacterium]
MSGANRRKAAPVLLTEKDMFKKVTVARIGKPEAPLTPSSVPGLGQSSAAAGGGGVIMVTAPVDYQIFRSSASWNAFTASHKGHFPGIDFSKEQMLILVSVSDLPSGIFKIKSVQRSGKETVVRYWVDPLAMSAENEIKEHDFYSAAAVPRGLDVRLEQVP